jgi:citrate synthase
MHHDEQLVGARLCVEPAGEVSVTTLYVYVGRKGLRSQPVPGSRERRYWKPDILRLKRGERAAQQQSAGDLRRESALTLITERGPFYRGQSALDLAETASLEEVAALLRNGEAVPGFGSNIYPAGDPRAAALLAACSNLFHGDQRLTRIEHVCRLMEQTTGLAPDFAFACMAVGALLGLNPEIAPFLIGRSTGWIAHGMEQFLTGEVSHREGRYLGPLPTVP